jgi:predicted ATPase/DNA-binding XRE family transcriptional regulator
MSEAEDRGGAARTYSFGYWLRRRRKALDLTQEALARAVACSRDAIRKIEADERRPSRRLAERLAEKLAVPAPERVAFIEAARAVQSIERLDVDREPAAPESVRTRGTAAAQEAEATPFVGRKNEYGLLLGLAARLTAGSGHVALIEGEAGIGKSRLMREFARYARSRGLHTLAARCFEIERAMAYQPVIDLVAQALEAAPVAALAKLAPVSAAEIAALVPALARRVAVPALSADFPEARQARLFRAIGELFDVLAEGRQLVAMIDDVQWADDASARFLHYLARRAATRPLLVVLAYRDEDTAADEDFAGIIASLRREPHARHLPLARLQLADTEELLEGDTRLAERLQRETDGNPFFLTSMLHALREGEVTATASGALPLPEALRASVRARLAHVPPEARAVLDVAAVIGRHFDFESLLAVTKESEDKLLPSLETLVRRRLLREDADARYDFNHDKLRELVYLDIGAARRMLLHRAVAEALEHDDEGEANERDARLAEHYERGHVRHKALHHMLLAAERSQRLFALRDALRWLDRAVALAETHPEALQGRAAAELYERRGSVRAQAGEVAGAAADIRRVIEAAQEKNDRAKVRDGLIQLGMTYRRADDYPQAIACLTQALAECRAMNDERRAADTLYHLGTVSWSDGRNGEAAAYHEEAVGICERLGLADLVAVQAYHGRGEAYFSNLEPRAAITCYERSIELARGIGDQSYESENLMMIAYAYTGALGLGDYATAVAKFAQALVIAERADLQWHMGPILLGRDHVRACTGSYGEAYNGLTRTLAWLESLNQIRYRSIGYDLLVQLLIDLGLNREAAECSERALALADASNVSFWRSRTVANRAIARVRLGQLDAGETLEREAAHCREYGELYQLTRCLEGLAEAAAARGDPDACLRHARELLALAGRSELKELTASARRWCAEALIAKGDKRSAGAELTAAVSIARDVGRVRLIYDIERSLAGLGEKAEPERWAAKIRRSLVGTTLECRI